MQLSDNLHTETCWEIEERAFDAQQLVTNGSNYMVGNGYLGYRGTFPEWTRDQYVGCVVTDTYDTADGTWKELCTVPNALFLSASVGGQTVDALTGDLSAYRRTLNLRNAVHSRSMQWTDGSASAEISDSRFASMDNFHLVVARYRIAATEPVSITLGIDGDVWSLNGDHFQEVTPATAPSIANDHLLVQCVTGEQNVRIAVAHAFSVSGAKPVRVRSATTAARSVMRTLEFAADAPAIEIETVMAVYSSNDGVDPVDAARNAARSAITEGYTPLFERHRSRWDEVWRRSDIEIDGDPFAQTILRFNTYHNIIATPAHTDHLPIGARGLSCQAYQGAAFWDQEIFNLPMFLYSAPEVARNILMYRYKTLDGARKKARDLGYRGAFYAWVSGDTGEEICPSYFFVDVLSGRKIRNHFNDWQIHVSPDIAYTVRRYVSVTGDWQFMQDYGAEMLFEIARFLHSHCYYKPEKDRYEFIRLLGPDEYHENVDNNSFTNFMARHALRIACEVWDQLGARAPAARAALGRRLDVAEDEVARWRETAEGVFVRSADPQTGLIEQFDGFFQLEDVSPAELKERLIDPGEYWGWPNGIAVETQVSKQADVLQLFVLHPDSYSTEVMRANYDYYEPRTQHGSSLSYSVYATVAAWVGYSQQAYDYFVRSATVDLFNTGKAVSGGTFIGGIHTAACGAAWQIVVMGFIDVRMEDGTLKLSPRLPQGWKSVRFFLSIRGAQLRVTVTHDAVHVVNEETGTASATVSVFGVIGNVAPAGRCSIPVRQSI
ncbi:MAG: glycoside hydrolase family 65 protein [Spirochaetaceae bacterium]|nr:MAG: glycoside hydrolase family 65 protein [Spirochaetaceae bacterium]